MAATDLHQPRQAPNRDALHAGRSLADALPELLIEARRISHTILAGWHGRRRAGPGETFWQFRQFSSGEPAAAVDWRRSARDNHLYVRETEWEAAHTIWLAPDLSRSMDFRSRLALASKRDRCAVLTLALATLLSSAGERVGLLGETGPILSRNAADKVAEVMRPEDRTSAPRLTQLRRNSDLIILGDFLDPIDRIEAMMTAIGATGARAHLVQIVDPIEESFPYAGRTEFLDPETGLRHTVGRAETYREAYRQRLAVLRTRLQLLCRRRDWTFLIHRTDRPATEPLLALHARLTDRGLRAAGVTAGSAA